MMPLNAAKPVMLAVMVPLLPTTAKQPEVLVLPPLGPLGVLESPPHAKKFMTRVTSRASLKNERRGIRC